ncbi:MAG: spore coat associated protein CotJA [Negativicutes bacterium]|nr:spore coat associated protein CotJA [Negativicutes bacterium]
MRRPRYPAWHDGGMGKKMPEHMMMPDHMMPEHKMMPEPMMMPEHKMMPMEEVPPAECMCEEPMSGQLLAHSYVPWQFYRQAFSPKEALMKGTLFPELFGVYPIPK